MALKQFLLVLLLHAFALPAAAQCCTYVLNMQDSYGDSWNGGNLQVVINGTQVGVFAATGNGTTTSFPICNGDQLQLIYSTGDWEEDNTYQIFDPAGNLVFGDGPYPSAGTVYNDVADCDQVAPLGGVPCAALPIDTMECLIVSNSGFASSGLNPNCADFQGGDIWFSMPVPTSGNVLVSTSDTGGLNDTGIALWTGSTCTSLTLRGCDDDGGTGYFSTLTAMDLPAGEMLYIQAFGYGGATGAFELCVADLGTVTLESSELPIVMINTLGQAIPGSGKINALMEIKYNGPGELTYITDPSNEYSGHIGIGIRGASSSGYPQKPYSVETRDAQGENNNISIFGMPVENDWVLLSNYNDRSLIRNPLAMQLSRDMGQYASRTQLCEVLIDSVYQGIYVFGEKVKRDAGRVAIATLTPEENSGDQLTGGYILTQNYWNNQNSFQSNYSPIDHPGMPIRFVYRYPDPDLITVAQRNYIASFVDSLETALYSTTFADPVNGYRQFLDVPSFITYFLVNEVSRNNDGFKKSVFFHKNKNSNGGKLKAGPVWDFDWAWKDMWGCSIFSASDGSGWAHHINDCPTDNFSCGWYVRLLQDPMFNNELRCTYDALRLNSLSNASLEAYIDSMGSIVQNAQARHFQRWPILGVSGPAPEVNGIATTYPAELDTLKAWIDRRLQWLDVNMPGTCLTVGTIENSFGDLRIYPNPSDGLVYIDSELKGAGSFTLIFNDLLGREIDRIRITTAGHRSQFQFNKPGMFTYQLFDGEHVIHTGKLVVQGTR